MPAAPTYAIRAPIWATAACFRRIDMMDAGGPHWVAQSLPGAIAHFDASCRGFFEC